MVDEHEQTARKSPRMRFTIRRMMVGVAIVAVIMVVAQNGEQLLHGLNDKD